ncbi:MAG: peptide deformylase [Firmicutes bacterium]|jgi:peptide deformylase|nr:peptide deformylase [Bacillota bacterium]
MKQKIWMLPDKAEFLRQRTRKLKAVGAASDALVRDFFDTWETVAAYGIAAPQIGSSIRAFIWKGQEMDEPEVIINPKIIRWYGEVKDYDGCLSVPGFYCPTRRAREIEVMGWTATGEPFRRKYVDFDARILQHEIDHLDGVLFIDRIDAVDEGYSLAEGPPNEAGEPTVVHVPASEDLKAFVRRFQRPIPGHALIW